MNAGEKRGKEYFFIKARIQIYLIPEIITSPVSDNSTDPPSITGKETKINCRQNVINPYFSIRPGWFFNR
jgi:hypothetical protein